MADIRITHQTTYRHGGPATAAWQMVQLKPRDEPAQECLDFQLELSPPATDLEARTDYFGNTRHFFSIREPHRELTIISRSVVRRGEEARPLPGITQPLATARGHVGALIRDRGRFELEQYQHPTARVPLLAAAGRMADGLDPRTMPLLDWLEQLGQRFADTLTFDPTATDVGTTLAEFVETRRGVCQDFTHLFLSCVRQQGLPAAYVSGYLLTKPPAGQPRLRGADAMHAWASVFVPEVGWVDFDPTNNCLVGGGHIVVARGRDFSDVSPTRGVFTGGGGHQLRIGVTVEPEAEMLADV